MTDTHICLCFSQVGHLVHHIYSRQTQQLQQRKDAPSFLGDASHGPSITAPLQSVKLAARWNKESQDSGRHSDQYIHPCQVCSRVFNDKTNLKRHLMVHTQEKPFNCHLCSYRSSRKSNLYRHLISKHECFNILISEQECS